MLTDIVTNIFNNIINYITGQNAQDRFVNLLDSTPNILSDKNQADGYVGTDINNEMVSEYYNEFISRADMISKLTANEAVGFKFYQINDAASGARIIQVVADSNINLYSIGLDVATGETGTYDINTDVFTPIVVSGTPTLSQVLTAGNTSGANDIQFDATQGLLFANTSRLREGTIDAGLGGTKGIAQICAVGYELKWEAGRLYVMDGNGLFIRQSLYNFTITPTAIDDTDKGYMVGSLWTLDDGTTYVCTSATATAAVWAIGGIPDLQQVTDAGFTTTNKLISDDGAGNTLVLNNGVIELTTGLQTVSIDASLVTTAYNVSFPDKITGAETFAMLSDIGVTSVGLSMPSAFSVASSPVTTSGTIAVTGAGVTSQYVRGDGSLANFPSIGGGGASLSYYLNGSVAQGTFGGVAMKEINKTPIIGGGTDFTIAANGYIQSFITDANDPNQLSIPAGNWNFETYFSASSAGGSPSFYVELYIWDGATSTLIASNSTNPEAITGGTAIDLYLTALAVPQTTLALTDRLVVRIYVTHSGRTITLHTEDSHLSQIITTFSTGISALNGLTANVQTLEVDSTGTDFSIVSLSSIHKFLLPTASASARGALSSADWSAFNGKQATLVSGTNIKTVEGSTLLGGAALVISREIQLACSDETTALTAGTSKVTFRAPRAMVITGVRASLTTAQTSGTIFTIDINDSGTSILSTKITIDNTEKTSTTAATPPVISDTAIADDAEITIDIDQIGDGTAKGLKITILYTI